MNSDNLLHDQVPLNARIARTVTLAFCALAALVPVAQLTSELVRRHPIQELDVFRQFPTLEALQAYERALERGSVVAESIRPYLHWAFVRCLNRGNEKVIPGRGGWLFYRPSVRHVAGPGFATRHPGDASAATEGDPVGAILHFREQLAVRQIDLLLLPMPGKESVHPRQLTSAYRGDAPADHADTATILDELQRRGVNVLDPIPILWEVGQKRKTILYLPMDTHWTPEGMNLIAEELATWVRERRCLTDGNGRRYRPESAPVTHHGDLYDMLDLPGWQREFPATHVTTERIVDEDTGQPWTPDPQSPILLIGDSFSNVFSDKQLGWGESAGLAEHIALHLQAGIDVIALNDGGVNGCRQRIARSPAFLRGKRLVIWQFATRDFTLKAGEWKRIPLSGNGDRRGPAQEPRHGLQIEPR